MTTPMSSIKLREAYYSDLPRIAHVLSQAFWNDNLLGDLIHPNRQQFPEGPELYWLRKCRVNYWDYRFRWLVAVETDANDQESIVGVASWERLGPGGKELECWWFDPRNLLKPSSALAMRVHQLIWPNQAADPVNEDVIERAIVFVEDAWSGDRAESWYLEALAVHPDFHGRGVGQMLVKWGLKRAQKNGICASVIAAKGTDTFYRKSGFDVHDGNACSGDGNPLKGVEGGNIHWRMPVGNN